MLLSVCLALCASSLAQQTSRGSEMWLEIPTEQLRVPANTLVYLSAANVTSFRVHLMRQPAAVNYGTIYARINTEAANMVMTTLGQPDGIVAVFDIERRGGFRLHAGRNTVEVSYFDQWRRLHYASFVLAAPGRGWMELQESRPPDRLQGEKYAVVVGVARQASAQQIPPLRYADRDASAFYDFLLAPAGGSFRRENVHLLLNESATTERLENTLATLLLNTQPEDLVVLFFAMHAAPDPADQRNFYLISYDADPGRLATTAFPLARFEEIFSREGRAKSVVTFADISRAFAIGGQSAAPANNLVNQYFHRVMGGGKRAVITASDVTELSLESERWGGGHGVFAWYLLEGLRGAADTNRDAAVTVAELFRYLDDTVPKATAVQHPMARAGLAQNVPLTQRTERAPK